jgi:hypothetical protein
MIFLHTVVLPDAEDPMTPMKNAPIGATELDSSKKAFGTNESDETRVPAWPSTERAPVPETASLMAIDRNEGGLFCWCCGWA